MVEGGRRAAVRGDREDERVGNFLVPLSSLFISVG
jgi:hypothetical protein